jgi:hypothetical protein
VTASDFPSPIDKPKLTLESIDVVSYESSNDTVSLAHLGTPEDRNEGIAGFEEIVASLRFH